MYVTRDKIPTCVLRAFPDYRGPKFELRPAEKVRLYDLNWAGGTRNEYAAVHLDTREIASAGCWNMVAPWNNPAEGAEFVLPPRVCVVQHAIFCGKDLGLRVHARPEDLAPLLPVPAALPEFDVHVLAAIAGYVSGEYRRDALARLGDVVEVAAAVDRLVAGGFLKRNVRGAVACTIEGKNACAGVRV